MLHIALSSSSEGFLNVYNQPEDFYKTKVKYDVLVTNPPYSAQHVERLFRFVAESQKPSCLLETRRD